MRLQAIGRVVFSAPLAGKIYAKHGTGFETRLTVIDKRPAEDPRDFSGYVPELVNSTADLLRLVKRFVPDRLPVDVSGVTVLSTEKDQQRPSAVKRPEAALSRPKTEQPPIDITDSLTTGV